MLDFSRIETERLILRPHLLEDADALHHLTSHPDVYRFDPGYQRSLEQTRENLQFRMAEYRRHGLGRLALLERESDEIVGYAGLQLCLYDLPGKSVPVIEFFYGLRRDRWGRGYMTEAGLALIEHGFQAQKLPRIISTADKRNKASISVMMRVGMTVQNDALHPDTWVYGMIENPYLRA